MDTKRFQLDLSEQEHTEIERLSAIAGIKTKREFVINAITLFNWAAKELLYGRHIGSFDINGKMVKQLEMPSLLGFAIAAEQIDKLMPSPEELEARANRSIDENYQD